MIKSSPPYLFSGSAVLTLALCFNCLLSSAQAVKPSPKNPEAASLAKALDYPVGGNTGVPAISVPLFSVNAGSLQYEVKASYHSGGIRVGQQPTWLGMNWAMNAAPQITRTVNNRDDLTNNGYLSNNVIGSYDGSQTRPTNQIMAMISRGQLDGEPDEFSYSLLNKSGKFFYQKYTTSTYKALPVPYEQLDIQFQAPSTFVIFDEDGTKYEFGGQGYIEQSHMSGAPSAITAWKCSRIISGNLKDTLTFEYYPIQTKNKGSFTEKVEIYDFGVCPIGFNYQGLNPDILSSSAYRNNPMVMTVTNGNPYPVKSTFFLFADQMQNPTVTYDFNLPNIYFDQAGVSPEPVGDVSIMQNRALKRISFKGNRIDFFCRQQADELLDSIRITNYLGDYIKTIRPVHSSSTLLLDELVFSSGSQNEQKYRFEYLPGINSPDANLPSDAWGYPNPSNGALNPTPLDCFNDSNIPFQWITGSVSSDENRPGQEYVVPIGKNNLESNEEDMKAGVIRKIIYPGGGYSEFEFEANRYQTFAYPFSVKLAGGLRIKSIKNYTEGGTLPASEKHYRYWGNGVEGVGVVIVDPALYNFEYSENGHWTSYAEAELNQGDYSNFRRRTFLKSAIDNVYFSDGSPVNYQGINVSYSESGIPTGMTSYSYNISHSNFRIANSPLTQHQIDINNGLLIAEVELAYHNGGFEWIKSKKNIYETIYLPEKIQVAKAFNTYPLMGDVKGSDPEVMFGRFDYLSYGLDVGYSRLKKQIDSARSLQNIDKKLGTEKNFYYDNSSHTYPTRTTTLNSKNELITEYTTYPQDYYPGNPMVNSLVANHKLHLPIENVIAKTQPTEGIITAKLNLYDSGPENFYRKNSMVDNRIMIPLAGFKFSGSQMGQWPQNSSKLGFSSDPGYIERSRVDIYDDYGNPVQFVTDMNKTTTVIWAYKGTYPVIEIENADFTSVSALLGSNQLKLFTQSSPDKASVDLLVATLKTGLPGAQISSRTYKPLVGMTSMTDIKGMTNSYSYDIFQRLLTIKDDNGDIVKQYNYHYKQP